MSNNKRMIICNIVKYYGGCSNDVCRGSSPDYGAEFGHDDYYTCAHATTELGKRQRRFSVPANNSITINEDGSYNEN